MRECEKNMTACNCTNPPFHYLDYDTVESGCDSNFSAVSVDTCKKCKQQWLKYLIEEASRSRSGRWWRLPIKNITSLKLAAKDAKAYIEAAEWCFVGGSYFDGKIFKRTAPIKVS